LLLAVYRSPNRCWYVHPVHAYCEEILLEPVPGADPAEHPAAGCLDEAPLNGTALAARH
jgi:hypothetical protein